jgi:hypothetical protein
MVRSRLALAHAAEAAWNPASGLSEPNTLPICDLVQLTSPMDPQSFGPDGTCSRSTTAGWCYVEGQAAGACPQQILFTAGEPPLGAAVNVLCQ